MHFSCLVLFVLIETVTCQIFSPEPGLFFAVGEYDEDCNAACARHSLYCDEGSLEAALPYTTEDTFPTTLLSGFGIECDRVWTGRNWSSTPRIMQRSYGLVCEPSDPRRPVDGYRCDRVSTSDDSSRVCSCFNTPTAAPTFNAVSTATPSMVS